MPQCKLVNLPRKGILTALAEGAVWEVGAAENLISVPLRESMMLPDTGADPQSIKGQCCPLRLGSGSAGP